MLPFCRATFFASWEPQVFGLLDRGKATLLQVLATLQRPSMMTILSISYNLVHFGQTTNCWKLSRSILSNFLAEYKVDLLLLHGPFYLRFLGHSFKIHPLIEDDASSSAKTIKVNCMCTCTSSSAMYSDPQHSSVEYKQGDWLVSNYKEPLINSLQEMHLPNG